MGKDADELVKDIDDSVETNKKIPENKFEQKKVEETPDKVVKKDELRKVIKIGEQSKENFPQKVEKVTDSKKNLIQEVDLDSLSREALEQKRAILQSIKDFDFLIKKNTEDITSLNKKFDSITKDLDDLVSLYEIVSEQMNPFVGLSRVTKKRLDTLENFTKEIEEIKTRIGNVETFVEKNGTDLVPIKLKVIENNISDLTSEDLDKIIENSFNSIRIDQKIDELIDKFVENLKIEM